MRSLVPGSQFSVAAGRLRNSDARDAGFLPEARVFVDALAYMQNELRCRSCNPFAMRHVVEGLLQFRMFVDVLANLLNGLAGGLQALFEFGFGFDFGFAERHLHPAVSIDFAFAGSF